MGYNDPSDRGEERGAKKLFQIQNIDSCFNRYSLYLRSKWNTEQNFPKKVKDLASIQRQYSTFGMENLEEEYALWKAYWKRQETGNN